MKIKATIHHRYLGITAEPRVSGHVEIQWSDDESWLSLGLTHMNELEWYMIMSLMALGARKAGIEFIHIDNNGVITKGEIRAREIEAEIKLTDV